MLKIANYGANLTFDVRSNKNNLTGKFLIATPYSFLHDVFYRSVIYITAHDTKNGSLGLIINNLISKMSCKHLLKMLKSDTNHIPDTIIPVHLGGPVDPERGFILHTTDYTQSMLYKMNDNLAVSSCVEILSDISNNKGPEKSLFIMGYTSWEVGQIEKEIENNLWLVSEAHEELIFSDNNETKWKLALKKLGIYGDMFCNLPLSA